MDVVALQAAKAAAAQTFRSKLSNRDTRQNAAGYGSGTATLGTKGTANTVSPKLSFPAITQSGTSGSIISNRYALTSGGNFTRKGATAPNNARLVSQYLINNTIASPYCIDFMHHGSAFDIVFDPTAGYYWRLNVDGVVIGGWATDGTNFVMPVTFGDSRPRRVRLESSGGGFISIDAEPTASIWKPPITGPRVLIAGDSYTAGTGATYGAASGLARSFANALGLDDVWSCAVGGTGWVNPGGAVKMFDRIADVTAYAPDYVIWTMGHNDISGQYTQAQVQAEAAACIAAVKAANPKCVQIMCSPLWGPGPASFFRPYSYYARDGAFAAATAARIKTVDLMEMPLDATSITGTLAASTGISSTAFTSTTIFPQGTTVSIGTYPNAERREVTGTVTGSGSGPYTHPVSPGLVDAHAAGESVTQVGPSIFTGSGRVGATTSNGNSDILIGADGAHPTQAGHDVLGVALATQVARYILPS
jgi:lysophospholipase L1-like esterase